MWNEKAVEIEAEFDFSTGKISPGKFKEVQSAIGRWLETEPGNVEALLLTCWFGLRSGGLSDSELSRAIGIADSGSSPYNRVLPHLLGMRGNVRCFKKQEDAAVFDFARCLELLQTNPSQSCWPYDLDLPLGVLVSLRVTMVLNAKRSVAVAALSLPRKNKHRKMCRSYIEEYLAEAPDDDFMYVKALELVFDALRLGPAWTTSWLTRMRFSR